MVVSDNKFDIEYDYIGIEIEIERNKTMTFTDKIMDVLKQYYEGKITSETMRQQLVIDVQVTREHFPNKKFDDVLNLLQRIN